MTNLCCKVLRALEGKSLVTAESCTGGGIGEAITSVPGSSAVYRGGVICYQNWVKQNILRIDTDLLHTNGPVSEMVAREMAVNVRDLLKADVAVSVTGLAGPDADDYGNSVGTVYIGYCDENCTCVNQYSFPGDREEVRSSAISAALHIVLEHNENKGQPE